MLKNSLIVAFVAVFLCGIVGFGTSDSAAQEPEVPKAAKTAQLSKEDQAALELGHKVLAVSRAIQNHKAPNAMKAVTDLGHDQRYYVMVRGWLSQQLRGDMSILAGAKERTSNVVKERIVFLKKAIRALDLE
jgi:hypothetical protein